MSYRGPSGMILAEFKGLGIIFVCFLVKTKRWGIERLEGGGKWFFIWRLAILLFTYRQATALRQACWRDRGQERREKWKKSQFR